MRIAAVPIVSALLLALALPASHAAGGTPSARLPVRGVLVPGQSLGGVRLGDTTAAVLARWGDDYSLCTVCRATTWLYVLRGTRVTGAAVTFRRGRVVAIFTVGVPRGWRTTRGVALGDPTERVLEAYDALRWSRCIGYGALSMRHPTAVTSVFTFGEYVYGFALTRLREPVCQ